MTETWVQRYPSTDRPWRISPPGLVPFPAWGNKARLGRISTPTLDDPATTVTEVNGGALIRRWERIR